MKFGESLAIQKKIDDNRLDKDKNISLNLEDLKRKIKHYEKNKPEKIKKNLDEYSWAAQSEKLKNLYKEIVN